MSAAVETRPGACDRIISRCGSACFEEKYVQNGRYDITTATAKRAFEVDSSKVKTIVNNS